MFPVLYLYREDWLFFLCLCWVPQETFVACCRIASRPVTTKGCIDMEIGLIEKPKVWGCVWKEWCQWKSVLNFALIIKPTPPQVLRSRVPTGTTCSLPSGDRRGQRDAAPCRHDSTFNWLFMIRCCWFADVCSESQPLLLYAFVCFDRFWSLGSIRIQSMPVFHCFSPTIWKLMDVNKKRKVENKSPQRCALVPRLRKEQEMKEIRHEERLENEAERRNLCTQSGTNMCHSVWYSISSY